MLFFSQQISSYNRGYANLFGLEDSEDEKKGEGQDDDDETEGGDGPGDAPSGFAAKWTWLILVDEVSETTRLTWHEVFEMEVGEFLNIACYGRDKREYEHEQLEKWKRRNR